MNFNLEFLIKYYYNLKRYIQKKKKFTNIIQISFVSFIINTVTILIHFYSIIIIISICFIKKF